MSRCAHQCLFCCNQSPIFSPRSWFVFNCHILFSWPAAWYRLRRCLIQLYFVSVQQSSTFSSISRRHTLFHFVVATQRPKATRPENFAPHTLQRFTLHVGGDLARATRLTLFTFRFPAPHPDLSGSNSGTGDNLRFFQLSPLLIASPVTGLSCSHPCCLLIRALEYVIPRRHCVVSDAVFFSTVKNFGICQQKRLNGRTGREKWPTLPRSLEGGGVGPPQSVLWGNHHHHHLW
jgi:hypothetical protein